MKKHITNALKMWVVLICAASNSRTMTYKELGGVIGIHWQGPVMGKPLGLLKHYCQGKRLPALTALVVNGTTGLPEEECDVPAGKWPKELRRIFKHKWMREKVPTPEDLGAEG